MATFSVHFDGPITVNHRAPIRVLSKTYEHMQRAIDRAYLIELYGDVWKHARLKDNQYRETDFIADRHAALELIDKSLDEPRSRLRSRDSAAELIGSLGLGCLVAAHWGNVLDGLLGAVFVAVAVGLQVSSVRLFLADYLGPAMLKAQLQGTKPPSPTSVV